MIIRKYKQKLKLNQIILQYCLSCFVLTILFFSVFDINSVLLARNKA